MVASNLAFRKVKVEMLCYRCTTDFPTRTGEVQFGILSDEETESMSTVQIKDTTIYYRGLPNPYGINDHRMGTVDRRLLCGTCCRDVKECQGHVGHIQLSYPMYHIGFFELCFKTLRSVCFVCSRLLLTKEDRAGLNAEEEGKVRFHASISDMPKPDGKMMAMVCTRTADMPGYVDELVDHGVSHVFLEKPGAPTVDELGRMKDDCAAKGATIWMVRAAAWKGTLTRSPRCRPCGSRTRSARRRRPRTACCNDGGS